ncbi:glycoside hydrolase family 31 protein [Nigerium massiliense]|uniref:glycoside hydrolase family 31 protein n=1 Tax=Nigerium massiliense TaxID=1522317 RepID=UPI00058B03F5|nr:TIM-barrel domain-containing protein [Nigerium massiliense]
MPLPPPLVQHTSPPPPASSVVRGDTWRITVLTDRLLRLEYSADGRFEDRATQVVLHRDFPPVDFRVIEKGEGLQLHTDALTLEYDGRPFSPGGLVMTPVGGEGYRQVWRYGEQLHEWILPNNLGGTARTLDTVDGACELEPGLMSTTGSAALDDSGSLALTEDGWVDQRVGDVDVYLFAHQRDFPAALRDFYRLTGPTPMLPRYALGNWWSRYYPYSQESYKALMNRFAAEELPFSVAVLDMDWHWVDIDPRFGAGWTGYSWNTDLFPDHVALLTDLHSRGLRVTLNDHPAAGVRAYEDRYPELARRLGIDPATEEPIPFDIGDRDFVAPYFEEIHHPLEDEGVDFWWIDWQQGKHTRTPGLDPLWALNHFHFLDSAREGRRPLTLSRYAGPGSHRYPVGFSGDSVISWDSLDFQPRFTATAANIGYGWWSHDIGGHLWGYRDQDLQSRWYQLGLFSPINRLHSSRGEFTRKEPWTFDAIHERVMGDCLRFRHRLLPYLYTMNERAHSQGEPLCRPLYYEDPRAETALRSLNSFLFGTQLLVAPITRPLDPHSRQGAVTTWLPEGTWTDIFTGVRYSGGREVRLHRPIDGYPVLGRAGAIVPLQPEGAYGIENPDALELRVCPGADGEFVLYEDDDALEPVSVRTRFRWDDAAGVLTVAAAEADGPAGQAPVPASRRYTLALVGVERPEPLPAGASYAEESATLRLDGGTIATDAGGAIAAPGVRVASNDVVARIKRFLLQAEIGLILKERIWSIVAGRDTERARLQALEAVEMDAEIRGPLAELMLAL